MAESSASDPLVQCLQVLNSRTAEPELFLSVQDDLAADFTSLTKTLYDLHKVEVQTEWRGSLLKQLVVENFDEEQIWQELELQNREALPHFKTSVSLVITDDSLTLVEEDEEEESGEEDSDEEINGNRCKPGKDEELQEEEDEELQEEEDEELQDSDIDFDVDKLESRSKQQTSERRVSGAPSEVDDRFFKLSEMEVFLEEMEKREETQRMGGDIDYFQDLPSGDDDEDLRFDKPTTSKKQQKIKSSRNVKYRDYYVDEEPEEQEEEEEEEGGSEDEEDGGFEDDDTEIQKSRDALRKVTFDLPSDSEGEDVEDILGGKTKSSIKPETKSTFERRQEKMVDKISELEKAALSEKPWQLSGEVTAQTRPENSMLEEHVDFEQASRQAPAVTEETTLQLEDVIKQRIKDQVWDDVVRKEKPKEEVFEYKKRLTLDHEKSKLSLAEVYEQEFIKHTQEKKEEEENPAHVEIQKLMDSLFLKLDALSNFHFTPKPHVPEVKIISNLPSIVMEEVAPVSTSTATLLAPEEVKEKNRAGDLLGVSEKTATDKKRERRKKKKLKHLRVQEREKRKKMKEAADGGTTNKKSKDQVEKTLKKLSKGGTATLLKDDGMDKALRSSQTFFSQLQDQVRSQVKGSKVQDSKKKKHKEVSVNTLKL